MTEGLRFAASFLLWGQDLVRVLTSAVPKLFGSIREGAIQLFPKNDISSVVRPRASKSSRTRKPHRNCGRLSCLVLDAVKDIDVFGTGLVTTSRANRKAGISEIGASASVVPSGSTPKESCSRVGM